MARFYGDLDNGRAFSRHPGSTVSGLTCHLRGWKCGVKVITGVNDLNQDTFRVWLTGGSENPSTTPLLHITHQKDGSVTVEILHEKLGAAPGAFPITIREAKK